MPSLAIGRRPRAPACDFFDVPLHHDQALEQRVELDTNPLHQLAIGETFRDDAQRRRRRRIRDRRLEARAAADRQESRQPLQTALREIPRAPRHRHLRFSAASRYHTARHDWCAFTYIISCVSVVA